MSALSCVSRRLPVPSGLIVQMSRPPARIEKNAIERPSGDHAGDQSATAGPLVRLRGLPPLEGHDHDVALVSLGRVEPVGDQLAVGRPGRAEVIPAGHAGEQPWTAARYHGDVDVEPAPAGGLRGVRKPQRRRAGSG